MELPASREVRLQDGITEGFAEHIALSIYSGSTHELLNGVTAIELTIESRRANAARELAHLVALKLVADGYDVKSKVDEVLEDFLQDDIL